MTDTRTPIEKMRYDLAEADKARRAAKQYDDMYESLRRDGKHSISAIVVRSRAGSIFGLPERTIEYTLSNEEAERLAQWFYEMREREHARAAAYEKQAIRDAAPTQTDRSL
jgi:hypothetical protein